jgi:hypothetical protein
MSKDNFYDTLRERYSFLDLEDEMLDKITDHLMKQLNDGVADLNGEGIKRTCYCLHIDNTYKDIYSYWRN